MENFVNKHSVTEKTLHNLAFKSWTSLISLSNLESLIFRKKLAAIESKKPVFITALPRAGTTLLLELGVGTNEFVSHTYSDMPFLLTPILWNRFSKLFRHSDIARERVHGDGIIVNVDSPEAFEEIIWKGFWPSRYRQDRIIPWSEPSYPDFEKFLQAHLSKIIFLRGNGGSSQARYISKNNLNIARIGYLKRVFPDSIIVIPFRAPLQHALSLLRQHRNFLRIHKADPFARKYMEDTGHYDFGKNLRPIDFDNWLSGEQLLDPDTLIFWLHYWINTYRFLLTHARDQVEFFSYDLLCNDPETGLERFGTLLEIKNIASLMEHADRITAPKPYQLDVNGIASNLLNQAETLFFELQNS